MTSPAKLRANRRNARKSTGPRTAAGKARAARNARRHGLNLPVLADPTVTPEIESLARTIATSVTGQAVDGDTDAAAGARGHRHACAVAELMIDLSRVRDAKQPVIAALHADPAATAGPLRELMRLDRYERRALWRRKCAIRAFIAAVAPARPAAHPPACKTKPTEKTQ
jgi:hypothetical protein